MDSNRIFFVVEGVPPKKDGANAMWGKSSQLQALKALRIAALRAMGNHPPFETNIHLKIAIYAPPRLGDLDNFITGICDGLMAVHPRALFDQTLWEDMPETARPTHAICFRDDKIVSRIEAERLSLDAKLPHYSVEVSFPEK